MADKSIPIKLYKKKMYLLKLRQSYVQDYTILVTLIYEYNI